MSQITQADIEAGKVVFSETRKGIKTTEFWVSLAALVLVNVNGLVVSLPDKYQAGASAFIGAFYALSRGIAKNSVPAPEKV